MNSFQEIISYVYLDYYQRALRDIGNNLHLNKHRVIVIKIISEIENAINTEQSKGKETPGLLGLKNEFCYLLWQIEEKT